jgi:hypothetical protein
LPKCHNCWILKRSVFFNTCASSPNFWTDLDGLRLRHCELPTRWCHPAVVSWFTTSFKIPEVNI